MSWLYYHRLLTSRLLDSLDNFGQRIYIHIHMHRFINLHICFSTYFCKAQCVSNRNKTNNRSQSDHQPNKCETSYTRRLVDTLLHPYIRSCTPACMNPSIHRPIHSSTHPSIHPPTHPRTQHKNKYSTAMQIYKYINICMYIHSAHTSVCAR